MKYYVYALLVLLGLGVSVNAADSNQITASTMVGRIGVGDNLGTQCVLVLKAATEGIYGDSQTASFTQYKRSSKKWVAVSESFAIHSYGGTKQGAILKKDNKGGARRMIVSLFRDPKNPQYHKVILNEGNNKYTVCDDMVIRN